MPKVSVVLPNYNYARYLRERIRSILQQSFSDFELIIVDDASTDESMQVIRQFAQDKRVRIVEYGENSGRVYQRWNDGAAVASGDWLWFAGADDGASPEFLETALARAAVAPNVGICHTGYQTIDALGRTISLRWNAIPELSGRLQTDYYNEGASEAILLIKGCYLYSASAILLRRDLFIEAGGFDSRLWQAADWHLYLRMLQRCNITYSARPLVSYRQHAQTVSNTSKAVVRAVEYAYCVAEAYKWLNNDSRATASQRQEALRYARSRVFDIFADPPVEIPESLRFAAQAINEVVPDQRLAAAGVATG